MKMKGYLTIKTANERATLAMLQERERIKHAVMIRLQHTIERFAKYELQGVLDDIEGPMSGAPDVPPVLKPKRKARR